MGRIGGRIPRTALAGPVAAARPAEAVAAWPAAAPGFAAGLLGLQRVAGNRAVSQGLGLLLSRAGGPAEREAGRIAAGAPAEGAARARPDPGAAPIPEVLASAIARARATAGPLPDSVRGALEGRFGSGLGDVRLARGEAADGAARALGAEAFAVGRDIVLRRDAWRPEVGGDDPVLVHEVAHVQQHRASGSDRVVQCLPTRKDGEKNIGKLKGKAAATNAVYAALDAYHSYVDNQPIGEDTIEAVLKLLEAVRAAAAKYLLVKANRLRPESSKNPKKIDFMQELVSQEVPLERYRLVHALQRRAAEEAVAARRGGTPAWPPSSSTMAASSTSSTSSSTMAPSSTSSSTTTTSSTASTSSPPGPSFDPSASVLPAAPTWGQALHADAQSGGGFLPGLTPVYPKLLEASEAKGAERGGTNQVIHFKMKGASGKEHLYFKADKFDYPVYPLAEKMAGNQADIPMQFPGTRFEGLGAGAIGNEYSVPKDAGIIEDFETLHEVPAQPDTAEINKRFKAPESRKETPEEAADRKAKAKKARAAASSEHQKKMEALRPQFVQAKDLNLAKRDVAMHRLGELLLKGDNIIASAQLAVVRSGKKNYAVGSLMGKASGMAAGHCDWADLADNPELQRRLSQLQLLDAIALQVDRNMGNIYLEIKKEFLAAFTGIDNDMSFGERGVLDEQVASKDRFNFPGLSRFVDEELATKIMGLDQNRFDAAFAGLLTLAEIQAAWKRVQFLQKHLQGCKLISRGEWNAATAAALLAEGRSYYSKLEAITNRGDSFSAASTSAQRLPPASLSPALQPSPLPLSMPMPSTHQPATMTAPTTTAAPSSLVTTTMATTTPTLLTASPNAHGGNVQPSLSTTTTSSTTSTPFLPPSKATVPLPFTPWQAQSHMTTPSQRSTTTPVPSPGQGNRQPRGGNSAASGPISVGGARRPNLGAQPQPASATTAQTSGAHGGVSAEDYLQSLFVDKDVTTVRELREEAFLALLNAARNDNEKTDWLNDARYS